MTEAKETTNSQQNWKQTFGYDRFGNRTQFSQIVGSTQLPINNITHPTIDQTNNRFTTGQGYVYDFNGNLIQDAEGRSFTFNGDDKQTEVRDTATSNVIGQYFYDGSGARVKKVTATETTVFVYDAGGALAAEYSTQTPPADPTTSYLTTDHLGSPKVITDETGQVISRRDFMPFGEELGAGVGPRTEALKYSYIGSDNIRQRFTGYEKDDETGLDFAEARMYQNKHGRFTAVDPLLASASATDPQTFNRYIYTGNNPVNYTDPSGLSYCRAGGGVVYWTGRGNACNGNDENLDGKVREISSSGCVNGRCYSARQIVHFKADGTTRILNATPENRAIAQGQSVVSTTVEVTRETAGGAEASNAATVATESASVSGTITPKGLLPLPCPPDDSACGSGNVPIPPSLNTTNVEPLKSVEAIAQIAEYGTLVPGLNVPFSIIAAVTRAGQGDIDGAGDNLLGVVPFGGLRRLDKAADVAKGGRFDDLPRIRGLERHHMPADSVSPISRGDGPAIQMTQSDHKATSSWGPSNSAKAYRSNLKSLIGSGQMRKAMAMEVKDVRRIGGRRYNSAIKEMLSYAKQKGYLVR